MSTFNKIISKIPNHKEYCAADIIEKIKDYDIISFDLYDTLITRRFFQISDMYAEIVNKYNNCHPMEKLDQDAFIKARENAVNIAQSRAHSRGDDEITLEEIYDVVSEKMKICVDELLKIEEKIEFNSCVRNNEIFKVYQWCINNSKQIIIVTDMYLSKENIVKILEKCNIRGYSDIFVSSEIKKKKENGALFKYINKKIDTKNWKIVHIGDNILSDFLSAKESKWDSILISSEPKRTRFTHIEYIHRSNRHM